MQFEIVPDQACPGCGAYWGNPNKELDFPNRIKVDNDWKCYNPNCEVGFYRDGSIVEMKLPPEEMKEMYARIKKEVDDMLVGKHWETREIAPGITESKLVPD